MPELSERELKQVIKSRKFKNIFFLYGNDEYTLAKASRELVNSVLEQGDRGFNYMVMEGDFDLSAFAENSEIYPFMAEYRCILMKDCNIAALSKDDFETFLQLLGNLYSQCIVIFLMQRLNADFKKTQWKKFKEFIFKTGFAVCMDLMDQEKLSALVLKKAAESQMVISKPAAQHFVERVGTETSAFLSEMDKLFQFVSPDQRITEEVIDNVTTACFESNVFDLCRDIAAKRHDQVFVQLKNILRDGGWDPMPFIGAIAYFYADLYRAKAAIGQGLSCGQTEQLFAAEYKGREYRLKGLMKDAERLSVFSIRKSIQAVAQADYALKTSAWEEKVIAEQLCMRLVDLAG